ncbi:glycosyltransferase [Teredinibacter sp. KSP-S5-2]|uniref:glycosyltransferase n=1 Tax=Teredinibacter sp. KSP-S5-2 TaxID=3034506 RepID=UPI002934C7D4|nr:glycosyltransferase [Teredinibacter sp. KSP-S5-2]WNO08122.1 glycosyltransferase [Teredinibacter sp. KSP-S5-2]
MKIAFFLSTSGHSGVDRSMAFLFPELCKRGYSVDLLTVRKHGPYIDLDSDNFRRIDMGSKHTLTCLLGVVSYLKKEKPDVLFADKDRANRVALLAVRIAKVNTRVVVSSGTIMSINLKNRSWMEVLLHKFSMNKLYPKAHSIIVPSIDAADDLADITTLSREQIQVVPLPIVGEHVDKQAVEPVAHPWFQDQTVPVIIAVGELSPRKDHVTLIKAFAKVRDRRACRLVILGRGTEKAALEALIAKLGLQDCVELLGFVSNPYAYIAKSSLLVHTATFEGFGMVLIEAHYLGVPVAATECLGGPREILGYGKLGYLSPVGDSDALAKSIEQSLDSPKCSVEELKQASLPYTVSKSTDKYLESMGF